jgi:hypothetical protein
VNLHSLPFGCPENIGLAICGRADLNYHRNLLIDENPLRMCTGQMRRPGEGGNNRLPAVICTY